jgi:hypothetical protein
MTDRKCFTRTCDNPALLGQWECESCRRLIEQAAARDKERSAEKAAAAAKPKHGRPRRPRTNAQALGR